MKALAERLSHLDPEAGDAIRVLDFYSTMMRQRLDLDALARSSANLAECVAGIRLHSTGKVIRRLPDGKPAPTLPRPSPASATCAVVLDGEEIGTVWLERSGPPGPFDPLLVEQFANVVAAAVQRHELPALSIADPCLVERVIDPHGDEVSRAAALRLLGFPAGRPVRVIAVRTQLPLDRVVAHVWPAQPVKATSMNSVGAVLALAVEPDRFPDGVSAGIGAADSPARAWQEAVIALRFATQRVPVVRHNSLGAVALLADIPREVLRDDSDVAAIARLAASPDDLEILRTYCDVGSVRETARLLYRHHSSVARRLEQIGKTLGIAITEPAGRRRAWFALTAWSCSTTD